MDACLNCPAIPADEGFLKEAPGGGLRLDSSGGAILPEGPFVLPPSETGSVELKGFVFPDAGAGRIMRFLERRRHRERLCPGRNGTSPGT